MEHSYSFHGMDTVISPSLIYYRDIIRDNIKQAIETAHGAEHLWPHIKSHKIADVIRMSMDYGITRFKCATIAEAEVAASCGASHIILAYPLIGPNICRYLNLVKAFPQTHFYAIGDNMEMLGKLGAAAIESHKTVDFLVDVDMGMGRTGVAIEKVHDFCNSCAELPGLSLCGLHCYDGHRSEHDYADREEQVREIDQKLRDLYGTICEEHSSCSIIVLRGSPSFPCHVRQSGFANAYYSPSTIFIYDYGYQRKFPDLPYTPGAAILTRVVSCPKKGVFTLDLGYKGIAADQAGIRGLLLGLDHCEELFQSEEHWTFCMKTGYEDDCPKVGDTFFVIPTHICPTSALYPSVVVVEKEQIVDQWPVSARNRQITY